ncbi:MAG: ABC transporter substrate-binding protein [Ancalomicrobiaceae bacterium]|nr:ABC transporter substrate-binding protein [Ancalomicrobiaceae bacterium]
MSFFAIRSATGLLAAALLAGVATSALAGEKAEVIHWWTSGSEAAAVKVIANAYIKAGGEWIDNAIAGGGGDNARSVGINRIVGGNPPTAMQIVPGKQLDEFVANGYVRDISALAAAGNWKAAIPALLWDSITRDGKVYGVPIDLHGQTWSWWSIPALKKAGVDVPKTWDEFFPTLDKLKAAGIIPIAVSRDGWTIDSMWRFLMISKGGTDLFRKVYIDHDVNAMKSAAFRDVVETLFKMRAYSDPGASARNWNDSTALVINNTAGVQFMGDWAKGEFLNAHKQPMVDFACTPAIGPNQGYVFGGDMFIVTATKDPAMLKSQDLLVNTMMSKDIQVAFNLVKGSIPVRGDVDVSKVDPCGQIGLKLMANPANQVGDRDFYNSPDAIGAIQDLLATSWSKPDTSVDTFVAKFAEALSRQ